MILPLVGAVVGGVGGAVGSTVGGVVGTVGEVIGGAANAMGINTNNPSSGGKSPPSDLSGVIARYFESEDPGEAGSFAAGTAYQNLVASGVAAPLLSSAEAHPGASVFGPTKRALRLLDTGYGIRGAQALALPNTFSVGMFVTPRLPSKAPLESRGAGLIGRSNVQDPQSPIAGISEWDFSLHLNFRTQTKTAVFYDLQAFLRTPGGVIVIGTDFGQDGPPQYYPIPAGVQQGIRTHVGATFDGTNFRLYKDGIALASNVPTMAPTTVPANTTNHRWIIGAATANNIKTLAMPGLYERLFVANRAFTAREMREEAFSGLAG